MRAWARRILLFSCTASLASSAAAQVLVLTTRGDPPALSHAEVALASGEGGDVAWLSLRVRRGPAAIVAALSETGSTEPAQDAWFRALEDTASPNVLLPSGQTECGQRPSFVHVSWPRSAGVSGDEVSLERPEDVLALLEAEGLRSESELPTGHRYVVWSWPDSEGEVSTRTLRLVGFRGLVTFEPPAAWPVSVNVLSSTALGMADESPSDELPVTFFAGQRRTDYLSALSGWLGREQRPLLEARSPTSVFRWSVSDDRVSVPPLVRAYARAAADELSDVDADICAEELQALAQASPSAEGGCGAATDAHRALAATGPRPVLQRFELLPRDPIRLDSLLPGGARHDPSLRAARLDESACPPIAPESPATAPPIGGGPEPSPVQPIVEEEPVIVTDRDESCTCSPGREPGYRDTSQTTVSCGGDTTSSTGDDGCSSDSSSTSDDGCSSDSSSTSDDSCSSDSSSTSDDSCSGSSDSGYDGDTCTGRAAPEAAPKATQQSLRGDRGGRPRRLRLSLGSLALAAVLLPIRRRKRGPSR
jgi:hypothetical protein